MWQTTSTWRSLKRCSSRIRAKPTAAARLRNAPPFGIIRMPSLIMPRSPDSSRFAGEVQVVNEHYFVRISKSQLTISIGVAVAFLLTIGFPSKWYTIGVYVEPRTVPAYHFGSKAMIGNVGWHYRSSEAYASSSFVYRQVALSATSVFLVGMWKRSAVVMVTGYMALLIGLVVNQEVLRCLPRRNVPGSTRIAYSALFRPLHGEQQNLSVFTAI